jgi:hypothetical protein
VPSSSGAHASTTRQRKRNSGNSRECMEDSYEARPQPNRFIAIRLGPVCLTAEFTRAGFAC